MMKHKNHDMVMNTKWSCTMNWEKTCLLYAQKQLKCMFSQSNAHISLRHIKVYMTSKLKIFGWANFLCTSHDGLVPNPSIFGLEMPD